MNIISTTDTSREGNDCYIYRSVSLVEQFGIYSVISIQRITGWAEREDVVVLCVTRDLDVAKEAYRNYEGVYQEYDPDDVYF